MDSEDDIFHTLSKPENFMKVIFIMKVKLIEVKRKDSAKRGVLWLFFTFFRCLWSKSGQSPLTRRHCCRKSNKKTAASAFVIIEKERIGSCLLPKWLQIQCSGASFCIFLWSNCQLLSQFYGLLLFSPCLRLHSSHCHVMDLF